MAIDHSGSLALLYGRRYLALINLDEPAETLKKVQRQSKYEVGTADWNPTTAQGQLFAFAVRKCWLNFIEKIKKIFISEQSKS